MHAHLLSESYKSTKDRPVQVSNKTSKQNMISLEICSRLSKPSVNKRNFSCEYPLPFQEVEELIRVFQGRAIDHGRESMWNSETTPKEIIQAER